ncbi:hypothetical protein GGI10_005768, partial [Coemansia sp. RSA 2530]
HLCRNRRWAVGVWVCHDQSWRSAVLRRRVNSYWQHLVPGWHVDDYRRAKDHVFLYSARQAARVVCLLCRVPPGFDKMVYAGYSDRGLWVLEPVWRLFPRRRQLSSPHAGHRSLPQPAWREPSGRPPGWLPEPATRL